MYLFFSTLLNYNNYLLICNPLVSYKIYYIYKPNPETPNDSSTTMNFSACLHVKQLYSLFAQIISQIL